MANLPQSENYLTKAQLEACFFKRLNVNEGRERSAYQDSLGYWTIGIGRMIDKRLNGGLSDDEMDYLLRNDIAAARAELETYSWYIKQDQVRKDVLVELCFNMGLPHLLEFKKMLAAFAVLNYKDAVKELINSQWVKQVAQDRINDLTYRIKNGAYQ